MKTLAAKVIIGSTSSPASGPMFVKHYSKPLIRRTPQTFDAVKMMRDVRGKISEETQYMTLEPLKEYIADKLINSKFKQIGR